jgi:hypothetical protein
MSIGLWLFPYSADDDEEEEGKKKKEMDGKLAVVPEHVRQVQPERGVCENDLMAIRLAVVAKEGGEEERGSDGDAAAAASSWAKAVSAAWRLSRNAWDDDDDGRVALCEGVVDEAERLCGVCYECGEEDEEEEDDDVGDRGQRRRRRGRRKRDDYHWRDRGWECHPQKGFRRRAAAPLPAMPTTGPS